MVTYNRTAPGAVRVQQLEDEINGNVNIIPSCLSVSESNSNLQIEMAAALSAGEETELDAVIAAHTPIVDEITVSELPFSSLNKLAVHSSPKPEPPGVQTYVVWTGAGDGLAPMPVDQTIGQGDLLQFSMTPGTAEVSKDVKFDPRHGRVWIHEAYIKFSGAGAGDQISADVVAPATPLQQAVDLDYNVVDDWLVYAGPGAGTHGLAGNPVLMHRTFSSDGDWNFDGVNLTPAAGDGEYKITTRERIAHRYINRVPLMNSSSTYFTLSSDESAELPVNLGYFLRVTVNNVSDGTWDLSALMEIYRERTFVP